MRTTSWEPVLTSTESVESDADTKTGGVSSSVVLATVKQRSGIPSCPSQSVDPPEVFPSWSLMFQRSRQTEPGGVPAGTTKVACQVPLVRVPEISRRTCGISGELSRQQAVTDMTPSKPHVMPLTPETSSVVSTVRTTSWEPVVTSTESVESDTDTKTGGVLSQTSQKSMVSVGPVVMGQVSPVCSQPV